MDAKPIIPIGKIGFVNLDKKFTEVWRKSLCPDVVTTNLPVTPSSGLVGPTRGPTVLRSAVSLLECSFITQMHRWVTIGFIVETVEPRGVALLKGHRFRACR